MLLLLQLIVIVLAFISREQGAIADYVPPYTSIVFPVTKHIDAAKPLYSVQIITTYVNMRYMHENFLIDFDAPFTWHDCVVQWNVYPGSCPPNKICVSPVSCEEYECTYVRTTFTYPSCPPQTNSSTLPGWGFCSCPVNVVNPVTRSCDQAMLNYDELMVVTSNGRNAFDGFSGYYPNAACAPSSSFASFPANVTGLMAFSSSQYAFPQNSFQPVKKTLYVCLPSTTSARGVLFFGNGPYYFLPQTDVDVRSYLSYTPLLRHPDSFGYYIGVKAIVIKKRSIVVPANTTTKLSTVDPYTILRTDIYKRVVQRFSMATIGIPRAKSVAPFSLCFRNFNIGTRVGLKVPDIDFSLEDGKKWTISSANSIKQITNDVGCLAFVDGGATSEPAIVIGTFQFEDNFLEFNLENSTFGFSSSLLRKQTSCANFNFTTINFPA